MEGLVPGRVVLFVLGTDAVDRITRRRTDSASILQRMQTDPPTWPAGAQAHLGNPVVVGQVVPALVVAVHSPQAINLKVFLDGADEYWASSVPYDAGATDGPQNPPDQPQKPAVYPPFTWHWMFTQQATRYTPNMEELDAKVRGIAQEEVATGLAAVLRPEDIRTRVDDLVAKSVGDNEVNLRAWIKTEVGQQFALQTLTPDERVQSLQERLTVIHAHGNTVQAKHGDSAGFVNVMADLKRLIDTFRA